MKASLGLLGCCGLLVSAPAAVYSPRILSPHNADGYSLKTFAQFHRWRELSGDAKVFEVYRYLTDPRTGLYPLGVPAREGSETLSEYSAVTDPVKMLNIYPIGHCGTLGPTAAGLLEGMGVGSARTLIIPGWHHVAAEVCYDESWHYVDLDVRAVFRRENGTLASMAEARTDGSLWRGPSRPWFFPLDDLGSVQRAYAERPAEHRYGVASGGHTMDFVLRQGEVFTRWWKPQGGRWNHHPSYAEPPFPRSVLEREPRGPKSKHESFTVHTHGNGRLVYLPNLTAQSTDFDDGVYAAQNIEPGPDGLTLKSPGKGYAVFEVRTPYVIVPLVGDLDTTADDREASVVKLDAERVGLALSLDNGLTWQPLPPSKAGVFDLTPQVAGRYGYLLRLSFEGAPDQAVMRSLEIETWVQVHPASLPSLRRGKNHLQLVTGDHYGLPTRVNSVCPDGNDRQDFLKHVVAAPQDYDPARRTGRVRGSFVVKLPAPPGTRIAWFSAGASFAAAVGATQNTRNAIAFAVGESGEFQEIYRANVPPDQSHWHYNVDREVRLDEPADAVWVRYTGDPAVNNVRLFAHCLEARPRAETAVIVKHTWTERGVQRTKTVRLDGPGDYEIEADTDPEDEAIELAIPSSARTAASAGATARGGAFLGSPSREPPAPRPLIHPPVEPSPPRETTQPAQPLSTTGSAPLELPQLWEYSAPLISPEVREREPSHAQKDPSIVFHNGRWHLFMTVKLPRRSAIEYCSFARWEEANASPRTLLPVSASDYYCAPQIFYFRPHQLWYLVYQVGVPGQDKMWVAYSTTADIADPHSWTPAKPMLDGGQDDPRRVGGLDYWIICDAQRAYLFLTSLDGRMWRLWTRLEDFPRGFGHCELALQARVFEASHTYKLKGRDQYLTLIEENGRRYYKGYLADRLDGEWRPVADTAEHPLAGWNNIRPAPGVEPWTDNVSHGELLRDSNDETLTVDPTKLRFLFQGMWDKDKAGSAYGQFQWRLGLLTPVTATGPTEEPPAAPGRD